LRLALQALTCAQWNDGGAQAALSSKGRRVRVDFKYPPEAEKFRQEIRAWLEVNAPKHEHPPYDTITVANDAEWEERKAWFRHLHSGGWIGISWPRAYGGRDADVMQAVVFHEELARFHAHLPYIGAGVALVGPTLIQWGTEAQKARFIPRILSGEDTWCQGYSEPNAGSDLTRLQTKASLEGDYFVVNGSKIWTSQAHRVDWMFLLCRTDPKEPGSRGLSYILVDMKTPGITTRPMVEINGQVSFNQVFFDNARVPKENIVGKINEGWRVANTTLSYERNFGGRQFPNMVRDLLKLAQKVPLNGRPAWENDAVRQRIAAFACEAEALKYTAFRGITRRLKGQSPGPESSTVKLSGTELNLRIQMFATELLGPFAQLERGDDFSIDGGKWLGRAITARGGTIAGGSNEIQRNIIGERVLRLPR
jgi:alkylation response protein AidB-like acyl-CoA dehydrogenase